MPLPKFFPQILLDMYDETISTKNKADQHGLVVCHVDIAYWSRSRGAPSNRLIVYVFLLVVSGNKRLSICCHASRRQQIPEHLHASREQQMPKHAILCFTQAINA